MVLSRVSAGCGPLQRLFPVGGYLWLRTRHSRQHERVDHDINDPLDPLYPLYWAAWVCPDCGEDGDRSELTDDRFCPTCGAAVERLEG